MGIRVEVGGKEYYAETYKVTEDSTPTSSDDSTGSVGTIVFDLIGVEDAVSLEGMEVKLLDTYRGTTVGFVKQVGESDNGSVVLTCQSRLGRLNIYDVQAQPFSGTFRDAFRYYVGLGEQFTDVFVDDRIAGRTVTFSGWYGELWFHLKQLAAAQDCEIALVSGIILLRPLAQREAIDHRDITRDRTYGDTTLARAVEVYHYSNRPIENESIYPPGGWVEETEVVVVGAGEVAERPLELSASVTYVEQPVMVTSVAKDYNASSVYTIVGDDGIPVQPAQWFANGGRLEVFINKDTTSLTVRVTGATNIMSTKGEYISTYSVALGSSLTGNRYSTLRLIGTGVAFDKQKSTIRTCIKPHLTGTEIGVTIDNPFISTINEAFKAGVRAARWYAGERMTLNGNVTSINKLGDTGSATYPTYAFDQSQWQGSTYQQVEEASARYIDVQNAYFELVRDDFANQVFGNAGGTRVWDRRTDRWFRVRSTTIDRAEISFTAEDDLKHVDYQGRYGAITYGEEQALFLGLSYSQRDRKGLRYKVSGIEPGPIGDDGYPAIDRFPALTLFPGGSVAPITPDLPFPDAFYPDELYPV